MASANFFSSWITGDLTDVKVVGGKGGPRTIDDIVISAELANIDGEGGVLGQAGPTAVRTTGSLPATAVMQFDTADATYFNGLDLFDDIVIHEMGHSLGFGSIGIGWALSTMPAISPAQRRSWNYSSCSAPA